MSPKARLLVVDDEPSIRNLFRRWLTRAGYEVVEASSGREAVATLLSRGGDVALVITDRKMPSGTGEELIRTIQATWPGLPIVCVTGFADDVVMNVPVVAKPVSGPALLEAVARALAVR